MKILLSTFIFSILLFGQNSDLINNSWYLTTLNINNNSIEPPINNEIQFTRLNLTTNYLYSEIAGSGILGQITHNENSFSFNTFNAPNETLNNPENDDFKNLYLSFFSDYSTEPFTYQFVEVFGAELLLIVTNNNNEKATYTNSFLGDTPTEITANTWYLRRLIIDTVEYPSPNNAEVQNITLEFNENHQITTFVCGGMDGITNFKSELNEFLIYDMVEYLAHCNDGNNTDFQNRYINFFWNNLPNPFQYEVITNNDNTLQLIISDLNGNQAIYGNSNLSIVDLSIQNRYSIFPNPCSDYINIKIDTNIQNVKVFNSSGQEILVDTKKIDNYLQLDMIKLLKGHYFVSIKDKEETVKKYRILKK